MFAYFVVLFGAAAPYLFAFLGVALAITGIWALTKVGAKFHIDVTDRQKQIVWDGAFSAVNYAEEWARKKAKSGEPLPPGPEKLKVALDYLTTQVEKRHLKEAGEEKLIQILESALHVSRPPAAISATAIATPVVTE